jgi:hypothetical protein
MLLEKPGVLQNDETLTKNGVLKRTYKALKKSEALKKT